MKIDVIIETVKGSAQKYHYHEGEKNFRLKKVLPEGMVFPFDFGFIPGTRGEDGDPLDVIVIAEFSTFTGCAIECRLLGSIMATQKKGNKKIRNDRVVAVPVESRQFANSKSLRDLPRKMLDQLKQFFVNYNKIEGKDFVPIGTMNSAQAYALITKSIQ